MERTRLGVTTKKGKAAKAKTGVIEFEGDEEFKKNHITITGFEKTEITNVNPIRRTFSFKVESFNKSEAATSKFLLKMGFEAMFQSQRRVFAKYDFSELKDLFFPKDTFTLLFKFKYGAFTGITNLPNRHTDWIEEFYVKDSIIGVYPENITKKLIKSLEHKSIMKT